jgi:methionyl-tRNA formyltransferase
MGTPEIALPALEATVSAGHRVLRVYTQPDRPAGRGRKLTRCPVAQAADHLGLPLSQPRRIKEAEAEIRALGAEACALMAFGQLLPASILEAFPLGCINVHTSLLPQLRGASPINQAIVQGLPQTGVTTMYMDQGMDTGDIIQQKAIPIGPQETAGTLAGRLAPLGAEVLVQTLAAVSRGDSPRRPQDDSKATYAPLMAKSDGLIDWSKSAPELDRLVRGLDPWPIAHTVLKGKPLRVYAPTALSDQTGPAQPGTLLPAQEGRDDLMWVACGQGALGLGGVQAAGKKRLPAPDFLRGTRLEPGVRLGE